MEDKHVLEGAEALAQSTRLKIIRLLKENEDGVSAGGIAAALGVKATTLSAHLRILSQCELVETVRDGKSLIYHYQTATGRHLAQAISQLLEAE